MKKAFLSFLLLASGLNYALAAPVNLTVGFSDHTGTAPAHPRTPVPSVDLNGYALTFQQDHPIYMLDILDENGIVIYSVVVPSTQATVTLPSWLSGEYEIHLYPEGGNIYFYGEIIL